MFYIFGRGGKEGKKGKRGERGKRRKRERKKNIEKRKRVEDDHFNYGKFCRATQSGKSNYVFEEKLR
jgi:hypothetical protein